MDITIKTLDNQLSVSLTKIDDLILQLKEARAERDRIKEKKEKAVKAIGSLNKALSSVKETFKELGESATELQNIAISKIEQCFNLELSEEDITEQNNSQVVSDAPTEGIATGEPVPEYLEWQNTGNPNLGYYYNLQAKKVESIFIGSNNIKNLNSVTTYLAKVFCCTIEFREEAKQLNFRYELKITNIADKMVSWLIEFNYSQSFFKQTNTKLKKLNLAKELVLKKDNWLASPNAKITNAFFPYECTLISQDGFGEGIARNAEGNQIIINLKYWHLSEEFYHEVMFVYDSLKGCKNVEAINILEQSNQIDPVIAEFMWSNLPKKDRLEFEAKGCFFDDTVTDELKDTTVEVEAMEDVSSDDELKDFDDIVRETDFLMMELGWNKEDGVKHLSEKYNKESRRHLNDAQLLEFLEYLRDLSIAAKA